ncbi:MAG: amidase [Pseudomonadota bacterium]
MTPTLSKSLEEIAGLLRSGCVTAAELAETHLEALARIDSSLNAVARLEPESAMERAARLDDAIAAGAEIGPLTAAPLAHKDLYGRKGWLQEAGAKILSGERAKATATTCAALDRAGAMDLGRLNTVEFALGSEGRNVHTGPVRNPWNPAYVPGGSSSGSAAAVAAGAVPAALGSDTGGSIRLPAAACGLVGLKPTAGLVGRSGIFPLSGSLDTAGPLCQTVRDAAILLGALAGHDPADPQSVHLPRVDYLAEIEDGLRGLRIGIARQHFFDPIATEIGAALETAIAAIGEEGARVSDTVLPGIAAANRLTTLIINVEASTQHRPWLAARATDYGPETLERMMAGLFIPAQAYLAALMERQRLLAAVMEAAFADNDAILTPVWISELSEIEEPQHGNFGRRIEDTGHCTRAFNFLGLPAVVLPCGISAKGLPIALQLVSRPYAEALLLRAARGIERALAFAETYRPGVVA